MSDTTTITTTGRIVSKKELAAILGVTRHAVARYVALGCPYREAGGREGIQTDWSFDTAAVVRWLRETDVAAELERLEAGGDMLKRLHPEDPRYAERATAAEIRKIELAELQARTLLKEDARDLIAEEYDVVRAGLREIPGKVAQRIAAASPERVDTAKIKKVLSREVEDVLECLTADRTT